MDGRRKAALGGVLAVTCLALTLGTDAGPEAARGSSTSNSLPTTVSGRHVVAGYVNTVVRAGRAVYVGGEFSRIANRTGSAVVVPTRGGPIETVRAEIAGGPVNAAVADGAGGWYVGGSFTTVGDIRRDGLAHVSAEGRLDRIFAPSDLGEVKAMALAGGVLVVVATAKPKAQAVTYALSARTGAGLPITYARPRSAGAARVLLANGGRLFIGYGNRRLAAYAVATGVRLWARHFCQSCIQARGGVMAMAVDHDKLIVVGAFRLGRNKNFAVLEAASGAVRRPSVQISRPVLSVAVTKGAAYVSYLRARPGSSGLVAVDLSTGRVRSWGAIRPDVLTADGTTVYMAGVSAKDEGRSFPLTRVYSAPAGTPHAVLHRVSPPLADQVFTLAQQSGRLLLGGSFTGAGGAVRHNLAAFDARTGKLLRWNPDASDVGCCGVDALTADGRTIYVGGPFKSVSGLPRTGLAAIRADGRGRVLPWHPRLGSWDIDALGVGAGRVFVGGLLSFQGNSGESKMVAFSARGTGARLAFAPKLGFEFDVTALTVWHRTLLVGGQSVIAYSADGDGRRQLWRRSTDVYANAFLTRGKTLYVGGNFDHIGRQPRKSLAALALDRHGAVLGFAPAVPIDVETLARFGSDIVFGGADFDGESTQALGAVTADGKLEHWRFDMTPQSTQVTRIAPTPDGLFLAGAFDWLGQPGNQAAGGVGWLR